MKSAIIKREDGSVAGSYDGSPNQANFGGDWGRPELFAHMEMPTGSDVRWLIVTLNEDGTIDLSEDSGLKTSIQTADAIIAGKAQVAALRQWGADLMDQFAVENSLMGVTTDNMTDTVLNVMGGVMTAVLSGSLKEAIRRAKAISPSDYDAKYITAARLLVYVNRIETKLGITLSGSL